MNSYEKNFHFLNYDMKRQTAFLSSIIKRNLF